MMKKKQGNESADKLKQYDENPFDPNNLKPEDIVRLFYIHNVPIIPVISKRENLLGVLRKKDIISELSDIERVQKMKIDRFITKLARKMSFDDLLAFGDIREFTVINIFGEVQGTWSRVKLFSASESGEKEYIKQDEIESQKDEQVLEWIIYLILEFIPRALYAVNTKGKTIFYNSHFESIYNKKMKKPEVDTGFIEKTLKNAGRNEIYSGEDDENLVFFNRDLEIFYEKIPMMSKEKKVGYLIFCSSRRPGAGFMIPGIEVNGMSLGEKLVAVERQIIINAINENKEPEKVAEFLKITKKSLNNKISRHGISYKK